MSSAGVSLVPHENTFFVKHLLLSAHLEKVMQTTSKSEGELSKVWCEKMNWRNLAVNLLST